MVDLSSIFLFKRGAFIIYLGGATMIWGGSLFFPTPITLINQTKMTSSIGGWGVTIFSWKRKGNENMKIDAPIIPVISTKCWYRTRVWNLMHFALFLCYKVSLRMAQTYFRHLLTLTFLKLALLTLSTRSKSWKMTCYMIQHG